MGTTCLGCHWTSDVVVPSRHYFALAPFAFRERGDCHVPLQLCEQCGRLWISDGDGVPRISWMPEAGADEIARLLPQQDELGGDSDHERSYAMRLGAFRDERRRFKGPHWRGFVDPQSTASRAVARASQHLADAAQALVAAARDARPA